MQRVFEQASIPNNNLRASHSSSLQYVSWRKHNPLRYCKSVICHCHSARPDLLLLYFFLCFAPPIPTHTQSYQLLSYLLISSATGIRSRNTSTRIGLRVRTVCQPKRRYFDFDHHLECDAIILPHLPPLPLPLPFSPPPLSSSLLIETTPSPFLRFIYLSLHAFDRAVAQ